MVILRAPLVTKIAGAYGLVVVAVLLTAILPIHLDRPSYTIVVAVGALAASLFASVVLVILALKPLGDLERTVARFQAGDLEARVPRSVLADSSMLRLGDALNQLLNALNRDRARLRHLAEQVVSQGDAERARLGRELYDSTAQSIAALLLELSVVTATTQDAAVRERLERVRRIAADVLEEIRTLSHQAHPRLLEERGLSTALLQLVREYHSLGQSSVSFDGSPDLDSVDASAAAVAYRVAQAALRSAVLLREAETVLVRVHPRGQDLVLEVEDDGHSSPGRDDEPSPIEALRHRIELLDGALEQFQQRGTGRVVLRIPLRTPSAPLAGGDHTTIRP